MKKQMSDAAEVKAGRWLTLTVGLIAVLIALKPPALILVLTAFSWAVITSVTLWPLVMGLFWKRANPQMIVLAMILGFVSAVAWIIAGNPWGLHGFITGISVSLLVIIIGTLMTPNRTPKDIEDNWDEMVREG
jgi:Na+/pantothenate symporter